MELVKDRQCGECLACCKVTTIRSEQLNKAPGYLCHNYRHGAGCGIYETRPHPCRDFYCGWRWLDILGESWRPDRSGVMLVFTDTDVPAKYDKRPAVEANLIVPLEEVAWQPLVGFIASLVVAEVPAFISLLGPPGHTAAKSFLNDSLADVVAAADYEAILAKLMKHVAACQRLDKPLVTFD